VRTLTSSSVVALFFLALVGCPPPKSNTQTPTAGQPVQGQYPQGPVQGASPGYPQQQPPPGYAQQPPAQGYPQQGYPQQAPPGAPMGAQPGAAPAASATLATPGPLALPCTNDQACGLAHCNTQFGKCAFPCQTAADCIQGASCNTMTGFCLPGGG
jgi:hypothetical protein